ncbi:hypothetical protein ADL15_39460 [Actinoplanes awajinensis subsp. mycoplanecinus]|uniref:Major facilitator superfamily (MFS) profile domain-containing protein n=1 Tax=Actinoplanes awajinensis subsp. mycoplanecinus TaxID=135947 RepID=A0A117MMQ0_9ACTN|nr:hypothetical protein ADL15_39460 [Actinoplanes awajinensis subsp. mycoplanecinus]
MLAVGSVWGTGVLAAAVLGAIAPISGILQDELGLSLVQAGWTTSIVTCVAAALGLPAGVLIRRLGFRTALLTGLLILGVAGGCAALADGFGVLLVSRLVAGAGYLLVFVAGPVALMRITEGPARGAALALWGTCVPIGLGVSAALGGAITVAWGWRAWLALLAVTPLILLLGVLRNVRSATTSTDEGHRTTIKLRRRPVLLATAFAAIAAIGVAVTTLLPRYLTEQHGLSVVDAGVVTAVLSFSNVLGSVTAALLLRRSRSPQRGLWWIVVVPVVVTITFASFAPTWVAVGAGLVALVSNGFLVSLMFALVPYTVDDGADADLANGVLAQLGSLGTLLAPPLFGAAVTRFDWGSTGVLSAVLAGLAVLASMFCFRRKESEG